MMRGADLLERLTDKVTLSQQHLVREVTDRKPLHAVRPADNDMATSLLESRFLNIDHFDDVRAIASMARRLLLAQSRETTRRKPASARDVSRAYCACGDRLVPQ